MVQNRNKITIHCMNSKYVKLNTVTLPKFRSGRTSCLDTTEILWWPPFPRWWKLEVIKEIYMELRKRNFESPKSIYVLCFMTWKEYLF